MTVGRSLLRAFLYAEDKEVVLTVGICPGCWATASSISVDERVFVLAKLDFSFRLLSPLLRRFSLARKTREQLLRDQQRGISHSFFVDLLIGNVVEGVTTRDGWVKGAAGPIEMRIYRADCTTGDRLPLVIFLHGGGWVSGKFVSHDWLASSLARQSKSIVISLAYRLAPDHPWPAAAENAYAGMIDVVQRADVFGADSSRVAVVGDSSGGNLAAVIALMARHRKGPKISFQGLMYPATDLMLESPSIDAHDDAPILTKADVIAVVDHYLNGADVSDPYVSPLRADSHSDLPPALIQVAEYDPLRDDGTRYAAALQASGVPVRLTTYVGQPHGFISFPHMSSAASQAIAEMAAELRVALSS